MIRETTRCVNRAVRSREAVLAVARWYWTGVPLLKFVNLKYVKLILYFLPTSTVYFQ